VTLDPRLNAFRSDLADERLRGKVDAPRFVAGEDGSVVAGLAAVRRAPGPDAPLDTFYHYGEPIRVFETRGGYTWCQSQIDSYVGYVSTEQITTGTAAAPTHFVATTGAYRYAEPDLRSQPIDFLPRHSALVVTGTRIMTRSTEYVRLDRSGFLPLACLSPEPPRSPDIVAAAELYLGCPYLWGGRSFLGIDCSGLVQNAFRDIGIGVLRDTDMQRETIGDAVTVTGMTDLHRGDLLYIPGHVLIYAGDRTVIHADGATMIVRRERFDQLMRVRRLEYPHFTIRRHPAASAS
jgi:cell wall-associated NlpC family hydrolase